MILHVCMYLHILNYIILYRFCKPFRRVPRRCRAARKVRRSASGCEIRVRILQKGTTLSLASPTLVRDLLEELHELGEQGELWRAGRLHPEAWELVVFSRLEAEANEFRRASSRDGCICGLWVGQEELRDGEELLLLSPEDLKVIALLPQRASDSMGSGAPRPARRPGAPGPTAPGGCGAGPGPASRAPRAPHAPGAPRGQGHGG